MGAQGIVLQPGQGPLSSFTPGRSIVLKLLGGATGDSITLFEETIAAGTKITFHLYHDRTLVCPRWTLASSIWGSNQFGALQ